MRFQKNVLEAPTTIKDAVDLDSFADDAVDDSPGGLEDLKPGPIADRSKFGRHLATSGR